MVWSLKLEEKNDLSKYQKLQWGRSSRLKEFTLLNAAAQPTMRI
jgi:hypothetical protein